MKAVPFLEKLGFTIHPEKSDPVPTQQVIFLGFVIDCKNDNNSD